MPLNFGGQKRSGAFDTVWPSATMRPESAARELRVAQIVPRGTKHDNSAPAWTARWKADSTRRSSQAVPHPSTNRALRRLTSEVGRDPVYSTRYGRQRKVSVYCTVRCGVHSDINLSSVLNHGGVHRRCWLLPWTDKHKLLCSLALGNNPWKSCQLVFQSSVT